MTGIRTEEARALRWDHVVAEVDDQWRPVTKAGLDHDKFAIYVWRSVRAGGDTKTEKSRRTLPAACGGALIHYGLNSPMPAWSRTEVISPIFK
jgi:integrase